jgi:hypothetical protein
MKQNIVLKDKRNLEQKYMENLMIQVVLMKINNNKKYITVEPLFKNYKRQHIYSSMEDSEVVLVFGSNNAGLKKLSSFV